MTGVAAKADRTTEIAVEAVAIGKVVDLTDKEAGRVVAVGAKIRQAGDKVKQVGDKAKAKIGNTDKEAGTIRITAATQTTITDSIHRTGATHSRLVGYCFSEHLFANVYE